MLRSDNVCTVSAYTRSFSPESLAVTIVSSVPPLELSLEITPRGRLDVIDVRGLAAATYGDVFDRHGRCLYCSLHTTAGYLPQSFVSRLGSGPQAVLPYIDVFTTVFPEGAGYLHDQLDDVIKKHGIEKGRIRLNLCSGEQFASLTVNEYETLLMRYDLAEVLKNPLRFAAQKAVSYTHLRAHET